MKKGKKIILLSGLLLILVSLTISFMAAWLTDTKETEETTFTVGKVEFTWSGEMINSPVVPGQNLVNTSYTLTNSSNVKSELRVKITITSSLLETDATDYVILTLGNGWIKDNDYWYYQGSDTEEIIEDDVTKYKIAPTLTSIEVVKSIILDGTKVGNTFSETTFNVQLMFEAKQSDYVTWEQLGTANIDFSKGISS